MRMSASHTQAPSDRKAAFTGLILGAIAVFVILFAVVKFTNAQFKSHEGAKETSEAPR